MIYLQPAGKAHDADPGGEMESLAQAGWTVIAPDVMGIGELGPGFLAVSEPRVAMLKQFFGFARINGSTVGALRVLQATGPGAVRRAILDVLR